MGSGWHEWPLVLFTVLGQCVVGGVIVMGMAWMSASNNSELQNKIVRSMFFLWVIMGVAFVASIMHLGSPLRAFNSLNRIGHSALSNEIASGSVFFAVGGFWWLVAVMKKMPAALGKVWLVVAMLLGLVFVWMMTRVYQIDTVPTWYTGYTTLSFFMTIVLGGPLLGAMLLRLVNYPLAGTKLATLSVLALLVTVGVIVLQGFSLSGISSSIQQASALLPDYAKLQVWRIVLLALGLGCWICPLARRLPPSTVTLLAGFVLVVAGELIGRGLFYGLHMTVGMAIAG
ncbi:dimethyl sulfoxide reductase anchor subunit [Enterobacteriaceae bacterium H11S18]|uniref:dimethyl sulfoxide reductase anchor subunit family protein n=1 Tax=Dryocola clanedunensis TaxID=2925396 RepID=UPI0022F03439|nr:dimethyl sulfoxide reductase anchor subunit family protein [Dryocola clanedunensis]MCT4705647.1 dimethyl sulfoxide reductase anchor subunit [Dryocola clanedunensis]MCT4711743.1 dimethyl sulfoxide reductase anchor subunit [Dryocola clanedunensis]